MGWLIFFGITFSWLFVGFKYAAPKFVKNDVQDRIRLYGPDLLEFAQNREPNIIERWRKESASLGVIVALGGPAYLIGSCLSDMVLQSSPKTDYEIREENRQLHARIADLEAEDRLYREMHT